MIGRYRINFLATFDKSEKFAFGKSGVEKILSSSGDVYLKIGGLVFRFIYLLRYV